MKFSVKIFWTYICIYLVVITAVGITVTENSYQRLREQEISRSVNEEQNIYSSIMLYLLNMDQESIQLIDFGDSIVDLFSSSNSFLEVFDDKLQLIATNSPAIWNGSREELMLAANGQRNFILRHDELGKYYLFICNAVDIDDQKLIISTVKDITHIDEQRKEQYAFFLQVGFFGLVAVAVVIALLSRVLIKPIKDLDQAAKSIAQGNYTERVKITSNDEVGSLAGQFNLMAEEVEGKIAQLEQESYRQQRFVDNLTHELRTPLTSIIGYAELLQKVDYNPDLFHKGLGYIYNEGQRMLNLNKILMDLTFYREEELVLECHAIKPLCEEVLDMVAVKAMEKGIALHLEGQDYLMFMERDMIKSLLINLVDNSIKASEPESSIVIVMEEDTAYKKINVIDHGRGMAEKELERIKEPFYRVDKARSRQDGGLGLGVAICNQIVERHHGLLKYDSQVGKGTTVTVMFPMSPEDNDFNKET